VICDTSVSLDEQKAKFKELSASGGAGDEIQLWTSDSGITKRKKFKGNSQAETKPFRKKKSESIE